MCVIVALVSTLTCVNDVQLKLSVRNLSLDVDIFVFRKQPP